VFFKDIENLYDVFCLLLFYATPIIYTPDRLGDSRTLHLAIMANPLYSIVEMFRDCVLRGGCINPNYPGWPFNPYHLLYSLGFSLAMILIGALAFWRKQDKFILHI